MTYYASAKDDRGNVENLVFDTEHGLWHIEDNSEISGFFRQDDKYFILHSGKLWEIGLGSEVISWYADSEKFFFDDYELNRVNEIWILAKISKGSKPVSYTHLDVYKRQKY